MGLSPLSLNYLTQGLSVWVVSLGRWVSSCLGVSKIQLWAARLTSLNMESQLFNFKNLLCMYVPEPCG